MYMRSQDPSNIKAIYEGRRKQYRTMKHNWKPRRHPRGDTEMGFYGIPVCFLGEYFAMDCEGSLE